MTGKHDDSRDQAEIAIGGMRCALHLLSGLSGHTVEQDCSLREARTALIAAIDKARKYVNQRRRMT